MNSPSSKSGEIGTGQDVQTKGQHITVSMSIQVVSIHVTFIPIPCRNQLDWSLAGAPPIIISAHLHPVLPAVFLPRRLGVLAENVCLAALRTAPLCSRPTAATIAIHLVGEGHPSIGSGPLLVDRVWSSIRRHNTKRFILEFESVFLSILTAKKSQKKK
jgi:hypothetical protein